MSPIDINDSHDVGNEKVIIINTRRKICNILFYIMNNAEHVPKSCIISMVRKILHQNYGFVQKVNSVYYKLETIIYSTSIPTSFANSSIAEFSL